MAVVGNSDILLQRNYATLIDECDYVLRFNQARVVGYEKYVGHRTTHRIVNHHTFLGTSDKSSFSEYDENFLPMLEDQEILLCKPLAGYSRIAAERGFRCPVTCLSERVTKEARRYLRARKGKYLQPRPSYLQPALSDPTSGFLGIFAATTLSDYVSIFGFDLEPTTELRLNHYWESVSGGFSGMHDFSGEREAIRRLVWETRVHS